MTVGYTNIEYCLICLFNYKFTTINVADLMFASKLSLRWPKKHSSASLSFPDKFEGLILNSGNLQLIVSIYGHVAFNQTPKVLYF